MKRLIFTLVVALLFAGCSKNSAASDQGPLITISSPSSNQVFAVGQMVPISATIADQDKILKTQIHVSNKSTGGDVLHVEDHPATVNANISGTFTAQAGVTYKIEVEAVDMLSNESKKEIEVRGN